MPDIETSSKMSMISDIFDILNLAKPFRKEVLEVERKRVEAAAKDNPSLLVAFEKEQRYPLARNQSRAALAVELALISFEDQTAALNKQAENLAVYAWSDMRSLSNGEKLTSLPPTYYPVAATSPLTGADAPQQLANFTANMVKEAAKNPALIAAYGPVVEDMMKLTRESIGSPLLAPEQMHRFEAASQLFLSTVGAQRVAESNLLAYVKQIHTSLLHGADGHKNLDYTPSPQWQAIESPTPPAIKAQKAQLAQTPKILELMGLKKEAIDAVLQEKGDPYCKSMFAGDLAVSMNYATVEQKNIALIQQAGKIADAALADMSTLKRCETLSDLSPPYYTGRVEKPTVIDAQQATANLAANIVKEAAANPELIDCLAPVVEDMVTLTKEIQKDPKLTEAQLARLSTACQTFLASYKGSLESTDTLANYLSEVKKEVAEGCGVSTQAVDKANTDGVNVMPKTDPRVVEIDALVKNATGTGHPTITRVQATIQVLGGTLGDKGIDGAMGNDTRSGLWTLLENTDLPKADLALLADAIRQVNPAVLQNGPNKEMLAQADAILCITRQEPAAQNASRAR